MQTLSVIRRAYDSNKPLDVTTEDNLQYKFYPVTRKIFEFEVRASHDARIALAPVPYASGPFIEIIIGGWNNCRSVIRKNGSKPEKSENETVDILKSDEFRGFWVKWENANISAGCQGEENAFLSWTDPEHFSIYYVGLCTGWGACGSWKIEVPASYAMWKHAEGGQLPEGAVVGGQHNTGELIYVVKAEHDGVTVPGKLITSHGCAYVPWMKREHRKPAYQVLIGGPNNWVATSGSNVPSDAFPGGKTEDGEPLFVGRVWHEGSLITGKVQKSHGVCYITFAGQELCFPDYEVLMH